MTHGQCLAPMVSGNRIVMTSVLLSFGTQFNLAITNTFFRTKAKHKATWYHPRSGHGHLIDFILTRKSDLRDICSVKVLRSAECGTDHKLVRGKFKMYIRKKCV